MKTREDFLEAISTMIAEAHESGFTLVIGFDGDGKSMLAGAGNVYTSIGLADDLYFRMKERSVFIDK